jgi:hypothetical protein
MSVGDYSVQKTTGFKVPSYPVVLALSVLVLICQVRSAQAQVDLVLNRHRTATTLSIEKRFFPQDDCAVQERCVGFSNSVPATDTTIFAVSSRTNFSR